MARLVEKLPPLAVSKFVKPGYYGDGAGLWLQVSPSRSKSWIFRFTLSGQQHEMRLAGEHALAHSLPDNVEAAYRRGDLIDKRVQLMKTWADYCAQPVAETTAAVVTPIRRKRSAKQALRRSKFRPRPAPTPNPPHDSPPSGGSRFPHPGRAG